MAAKRPAPGGKKGVTVDFSGVESGGGRAVDDGEYVAEVTSVTEEESDSGNPYLAWKWKIIEAGDAKGATVYDNTSLQPQALWRLKGLLEVVGFDVPDSAMTLDLKALIGKKATLEITNEEYRGKNKPRVTAFNGAANASTKTKAKAEEEEEEEVEEEEEAPPPKKTTMKKKVVEEEVEEEEADDDDGFKKGQKVSFKDEDGKRYKGTVVSVEDDVATVKVGSDEYEVELENLKAL